MTFNLGSIKLSEWNFIKVSKSKRIEKAANRGIAKIIKLYFDENRVLKEGVSDRDRIAIIAELFKNKLSTYIDDETGYLVIY